MTGTGRPPFALLMLLALRGLWALALARWSLHRIGPKGVQQRNAEAAHLVAPVPAARADERCDRIAFIIPRIARRVPWRADCLVQALAGQSWLRAQGVASEIVIGTAKYDHGGLEAHAWLRRGEQIILGGDVARFEPLLAPDPGLLDRSLSGGASPTIGRARG